MAASFNESQKIDYLWKKVGYGVTKTAEPASKEAFNESIASPLLYRGDLIWTQSGDIPATPPANTTALVQVYKDGGGAGYSPAVQCTEDLTAPDNQTWKTNSINWIPTQFGDNYLVQVYAGAPGLSNPQTTGTKLFGAGSGSDDTWFFDYQSGVLNFNGATIPTAIGTGTANTIYIVGYRYVGEFGVDTTFISNGTSNVNIATANGNITMGVNGTGNVAVISNTGAYVSGVVSASGNVSGNYFIGNGSQLTGVTAASVDANALTGNTLSANVTNSSLTSVGTLSNVSVAGNVVGGNVITAGLISATADITSAANIVGGNVTTVGQVSATGNIQGGNVLTAGVVSATANVTGGNVLTGGLISATSTIASAANITGGNLITTGLATVTGNITGGNILTGGLISATATITAAANITGGNLLTAGSVSATADITGGNLLSGGLASVTGNVTGGNLLTAGLISATGNIQGGNVNTNQIRNASGNLTIGVTSGNLLLQPSGNIVLSANTYINNLAYPAQDGDAATKQYVDNFATTGISYHQPVTAATTTTLATTTGGTITYTQPNGAANGIGALLTTTGSFNLIDTANVQTIGTRILVKNEGNAVFNGVYTWANATNIIRSTDADSYGSDQTDHFSINDYFYTTGGNVNAGTAFIVSAPTGVITFGTSNIEFSTFSTSQVYSANTAAGISLNGTVINAKVDQDTTAFDGGGNIIVKAGANLTTPNIGAATGTSISLTANVTGGNVLTGGVVSATANVIGGNILTAGLISATSTITSAANITGGNVLTGGLISSTGSITSAANVNANNVLATTIVNAPSLTGTIASLSGNVTGGNVVTAGLISATSTITSAANITGGNVLTGGVVSATGNVTSGGVITTGPSGNISGANVISATTLTITANVIGGNVLTGGLISAAGNVTSGNLINNGTITSTGNITAPNFFGNVSGNITGNIDAAGANTQVQFNDTGDILGASAGFTFDKTANLLTVTGNVASGNITTAGQVSATANVTGGNVLTSGLISATGTVTGSSFLGAVVSVIANVTGGNVLTGGLISAASTVTGSSLLGSVASLSGNVTGGNVLTGGLISATSTITSAANIAGGNLLTGGLASVTGNVTGGNVLTGGLVSATANVTGGNVLTGGLISATSTITSAANIAGGNLLTGGLISAASTVTGSSLLGSVASLSGNVTGGNLLSGAIVSASGDIQGGNILTAGLISATGNIQGGNVNTNQIRNVSGALTIGVTGGNLLLQPSGNVVLSANTYINNLAYPFASSDAATKEYVDNLATTAIAYHQAVYVATTANLATTTGGAITYAQPNGVANGIGATITTTGTFDLIDTGNVQTLGTRILVKNEGNAVFNGVYTWSNATVITRSTDTDQYGANSAEEFSINDYFFVQSGNVNAGSAYIVDSPTGTITFGTSNIAFAQFSSSQVYTANTAAGISLNGTVINAKVDQYTTAFDGGGNIIVKAGANLTTPNIGAATGTSISLTGNVTGGNVLTGGLVSATANVTGGNVLTGGLISATGTITSAANITGGNVLTGGLISSTGSITSAANVNANNVIATTIVNAPSLTGTIASLSGNVTGGNVLTGGLISATSTITSAANITGGNVLTGGLISATGTVTGSSFLGAVVSVTANVTGGNVLTGGLVSATGNITGGNILTVGKISTSGNITGGNILSNNYYYANGTPVPPGIIYTANTAPPTSPAPKVTDQWYDTTSDVLYEYINDGTSNYWVDTTSPAFAGGVVANVAISGTLIPIANVTYDIGTSSVYFRNTYTQNLYTNNRLPAYNMPLGAVVQTVMSSSLGGSVTNSGSYVDVTYANVTITPSSATSKVLILATGTSEFSALAGTNVTADTQLVRSPSTSLQVQTVGTTVSSGGIGASGAISYSYLDAPGTTGAVTYKLQQRVSNTSSTLTSTNIWLIAQEITAS